MYKKILFTILATLFCTSVFASQDGGPFTNPLTPSISTNALKSATTTVDVSGATAPTTGQVLTAVSGTSATWQAATGGITGSGTANNITKFTGATVVGNSQITDNGTTVGITGVLRIPITTSLTSGVISQSTNTLLHTYGSNSGSPNYFLGWAAGNFTLTPASAIENVGIGSNALSSLTTGSSNTAVGKWSGINITSGNYNTFYGSGSGYYPAVVSTGSYNTFIGTDSGADATGSVFRVAIGYRALASSDNSAVIGNNLGIGGGSYHVGINMTTPTAWLHLPAGTAAANTAPLKFTSGSLLTTTEAGAIEFLTDAYYATITTGAGTAAARKTFAFLESPAFTTQISTPKIVTASGNLEILPAGNANIILQGSGTGNVGIGTTSSPVSILAVAGGTITSTGPNGAALNPIVDLSRTAQPTLAAFTKISNTGGTFYSGIEGFAGNSIASGASAYATVLWNAGATPMQFGTSDAVRMTILSGGNVGIGLTVPTAVLHLKAGTATANTAPLKFNSGALLTTPEAGAVEFLTDAWYGTITTGAVRKTFAFTDSNITGNASTATALQTARTIAGVSFNGTANIAIPLDNLSNALISSPVANQILAYNGANWVNITQAAAGGGAGSGISFYPQSGTITGTSTNNGIELDVLGRSPDTATFTSTVTISIATPAVISWTSNGANTGQPVVFTTTGTLPTGITAGTTYYVSSAGLGANSFQISTTFANAIAGSSINTSGTQSGVQTGTFTEEVDSVTVNNNTAIIGAYLYATALNRTSIDSGVWTFHTYAGVDATNSGNSNITRNINRVRVQAETVTVTGTGTSRTATASGGTPFAVAAIDPSAGQTISSFIQTPQGLYQITARTSDTVVTITTPTGYVNETAVSMNVWKKLFGSTSATISNVSPNWGLYEASSVQPLYTILSTDELGIIYYGTTTRASNTFVSLIHSGSTHYTHFDTPLSTLHNELAGLQGGTTNQYYHMTSAEYAGSGTGIFARTTSPAFTTQISTPKIVTASGNLEITPGGNANILLQQTGTGNVGIGLTPTAVLHLKAGTATVNTAPLQFTSGPVETTPRAGLVEYDGVLTFTAADALRTPLNKQYVLASKIGANFNVTTDQSITIPAGRWIIRKIVVNNASISLTTAAGGLYTGASKTGTTIVGAAQAYSALTASGKFLDLTLAAAMATDILTATTIYFSLTTAQGAAATGDIFIIGDRLDY